MKLVWFLFYVYCSTWALNIDDLKEAFRDNPCILSTFETFSNEERNEESDLDLEESIQSIVQLLEKPKNSDKTVLTRVHELAQFNKIKNVYELLKEEGKPHEKVFTVSLRLGDESFEGKGRSMKEAQRNAASSALLNTNYEHPPEKESSFNSLTPTVLLNNLAAKLGLSVIYKDSSKELLGTGTAILGSKSYYLQKLNNSINYTQSLKYKEHESPPKGPFKMIVQVGMHSFTGKGNTIQEAKHNAATNAIEALKHNNIETDNVCMKDSLDEKCQAMKDNLKSPISKVYELGQERKVSVDFQLVEEYGKKHKTVFVTECRFDEVTARGEGKSKKESKRNAAEAMLQTLSTFNIFPKTKEPSSKDKKNKKKKKKNKNFIKTNFDRIESTIENIASSFKSIIIDSESQETKKQPKKQNSKNSAEAKLLGFSRYLGFDVQFLDLNEKSKHASVLTLYLNPSYACLGEGISKKDSRNKAALSGLKLLFSMKLLDLDSQKALAFTENLEETNVIVPLEEIQDS